MGKKRFTSEEEGLQDQFFKRYRKLDPKYRKIGDKAIKAAVVVADRTRKLRDEGLSKGQKWIEKRKRRVKKIIGK